MDRARFNKLIEEVKQLEIEIAKINGKTFSTLPVTISDIRKQVSRGFERRNDQTIFQIFARHSSFRPSTVADELGRCQVVRPCAASAWLISKESLREALKDLDVTIRDENIDHVFFTMDMDDNKGLDLNEFKRAVQAGRPRLRTP